MNEIPMKKTFFTKLVNKYYERNKEKLWKEARERYQNRSEEEKGKKRPKKDVKKEEEKEKEKNVSVLSSDIRNVSRSYLSIEEIII